MSSYKIDLTGIILAGGKSKRMGIDKGLMNWNGQPMIINSIEALLPFANQLLISSTNKEYEKFNLEVVPDEIPGLGPIGGLLTCLEKSRSEACLCLPCDAPYIKPDLIEFLLSKYTGSECVVPLTPLPEPLFAIYPIAVIPVIKRLIELKSFSLLEIFKNYPTSYIHLNDMPDQTWRSYFFNFNSPDDIKQ